MNQGAPPRSRNLSVRWIEDGPIGERAETSERAGPDMDGEIDQVSLSTASIRLSQKANDYGEVALCVTLGERQVPISLPSLLDPLPALLNWLQAVQAGALPIAVELDEEGPGTSIAAYAAGDDRLVIAAFDRWEQREWATAVVNAQDILGAFRSELLRFLASELNVGNWLANPFDEPDEGYLTGLLAHPFLA